MDDLHAEYHLQVLLRLRWLDKRLNFEEEESSLLVPKIVGDEFHYEKLWSPKLHVVNDRQGGSGLTKPDPGSVLVHIEPTGRILLSQKANLKLTCNMKYDKYPMDQQTCQLILESSTLSELNLILWWAEEEPVSLNDNFDLPGFHLEEFTLEKSHIHYKRTGNFSRLYLEFKLRREFVHFLLDIYLPSIFIVAISWTSLWLDIPAAPARVSLGITSMLTLVTITRSSREKLPKLSYAHNLDIWNIVCTGFVFATLVEYALVNFIYHKDRRRRRNQLGYLPTRNNSVASFTSLADLYTNHGANQQQPPTRKSGVAAAAADMTSSPPPSMRRQSLAASEAGLVSCLPPITPEHIANGIDRKCRCIFPIAFAVFNAIYWSLAR